MSPSSNTKRETCPSAHLNQLRSLRRRPPQRAKPRPLATRAAMKKPRSEKPCPQSEPLTYRTGSLTAETWRGPESATELSASLHTRTQLLYVSPQLTHLAARTLHKMEGTSLRHFQGGSRSSGAAQLERRTEVSAEPEVLEGRSFLRATPCESPGWSVRSGACWRETFPRSAQDTPSQVFKDEKMHPKPFLALSKISK